MRQERIEGTHYRTYCKLLDWLPKAARTARFIDGHFYSGSKSLHLTSPARRLAKLRMLRNPGLRNPLLTITLV